MRSRAWAVSAAAHRLAFAPRTCQSHPAPSWMPKKMQRCASAHSCRRHVQAASRLPLRPHPQRIAGSTVEVSDSSDDGNEDDGADLYDNAEKKRSRAIRRARSKLHNRNARRKAKRAASRMETHDESKGREE